MMKQNKNLLFIIFFAVSFLLANFTGFAQTAGKTGLSFLKIGAGARNIALGGNGNVLAQDVTSVFYNPANLKNKNNNELFISHNEWIQDVRSELIAAKFELFGLQMGLGVNSTSVSGIEVRRIPGEAEAEVKATYFAAGLSAAFNVTRNINAGVSVKYLYESLFADEANGLGFDFGLNYREGNLLVAAAVNDIGSMNELRKESSKLPTKITIGASYFYPLSDQNLELNGGFEGLKYLATDDIHLNFGLECIYDKTFALRLGYQTMYESKNITAGAGVYYKALKFDYAFSPFSLNLGSGHTFSLGFEF